MGSLVLELQKEVMKEDCDVLNLLRKAHIIAAKLNFEQFDEWIQSELYGYTNKDCLVPEYRLVKGIVKGLNLHSEWVQVVIDKKITEDKFCNYKMTESLGDLIGLDKNSDMFEIYYSAKENSMLNSLCKCQRPTQFCLHCSTHQIKSIIEQVKNTILEWTIKLEKEGILGEEMQFNSEEKEAAKRIPQQIINYNNYGNTNVINGNVQDSVFVTGDENAIKYTIEKANKALSEIESSLDNENISSEDKETVMEIIADIKEKVSQNKKTSIVKSAFIGLLNFAGEVGAGLTSALIQSKIQGLF